MGNKFVVGLGHVVDYNEVEMKPGHVFEAPIPNGGAPNKSRVGDEYFTREQTEAEQKSVTAKEMASKIITVKSNRLADEIVKQFKIY